MEPTIVYKKGGQYLGPKGSTYSYKGVSDETVLKNLLSDGWFSNMEDAMNPPEVKEEAKVEVKVDAPEVNEDPLPSIEDLLKAGELSPKEIADKFGIHVNSVYKVRRDNAL